jgi:hypothetical protein
MGMYDHLFNWKQAVQKFATKLKSEKKQNRRDHRSRRLRLEALEGRQMLSITVNTLIDEQDNSLTDGDRSLRDAVILAPAGETINFDSTVPGMNGGTINLLGSLGEIAFAKNLTIDASGLTNGITISAAAADSNVNVDNGGGIRIFNITDSTGGATPPLVTLKNLTLKGGDVSGSGGAIKSEGFLKLENCTIDDNNATGFGGGVYLGVYGGSATARNALTITGSTISNNSASRGGGVTEVSSLSPALHAGDEFGGGHAQCMTQPEERIECGRHAVIFEAADERTIDFGFKCQLLLRHAGINPGLLEDIAKHAGQFSCLAA